MPNEMMTEKKQHSATPPPQAWKPSVEERHTAVPSSQAEPQQTMPPKSPSQEESSAWTPELTAGLPQPAGTQPSVQEAPQVAAIPPAAQPKTMKPDYGWLSELMARWIQDLEKRYPAILRTEGVQGKVTLTAVLHQDGMLSDVRIAKSSGNAMLDQVAVEDVRKGPPVRLSHALGKPQMPVKFSIIYDLKAAQ
jgi:periplasmic protein TonB